MVDQMSLASRPRKQLDALRAFTLSVRPEVKQKSLEEILADLSAAELEQLQKYGRMILNLSSPYSGSYYQQIYRMYKNLDRGKQLLLAELLQRIQPREDTSGPQEQRMKQLKAKNDYISEMLKFVQKSQKNNLDFRTPEQKQEQYRVSFTDSIDRTMQSFGYDPKGNNIDFSKRTTEEKPAESLV